MTDRIALATGEKQVCDAAAMPNRGRLAQAKSTVTMTPPLLTPCQFATHMVLVDKPFGTFSWNVNGRACSAPPLIAHKETIAARASAEIVSAFVRTHALSEGLRRMSRPSKGWASHQKPGPTHITSLAGPAAKAEAT
jgi:hypothetical protein